MALTIIATAAAAAAITQFGVRTDADGRTEDGALINNPPYFKQTLSTYANTKYVCGKTDGSGPKCMFGPK